MPVVTIAPRESRRTAPRRVERKADTPVKDLLATVAHEVRTPITSLRTTIDLLMDDFDSLSHAEATEMLRRLQRGTLWLEGLLENFIGSMSLDAEGLDIARRPFVLGDCIEGVLMLTQPLLERRAQAVKVTGNPREITILGDERRIGQVLLNVLVNASKYSIAGDVFELAVARTGDMIEIRVSDHGPGVPPEEREAIFGRYVRGSTAATATGLGLGLDIVRALVELHNGSVRVEDTPGGGATFVIRLPASVAINEEEFAR